MSTIEWTDETWNPVRGCSLVSAGCQNCYAMKQAHRFSGAGQPYEGLTALLGGNAMLAMAMGPDEEMTMPLMEPLTLVVCEACAGEPTEYWVHRLAEYESTVQTEQGAT